jgi:hypothetical protein
MVSSLDEPGSCATLDLIADDSPLRGLLTGGSSEREEMECVLRLLLIALESDE